MARDRAREGRPWIPEEDATLRARYGEDGVSSDDLGRELGRGSGAVRRRAWILGLTRERADAKGDDWIDRLYALRDEGHSVEAIAQALGCHRSTVESWCQRECLYIKGPRILWTAEEDDLIRSRTPAAEVAAKIGRTPRAVHARRHRLRVQDRAKGG